MCADMWIFPDFTKSCKTMIDGHGDDLYRYGNVAMNFSSNIFAHADLSGLEDWLRQNVHLIRSYPEPSPRSLEVMLARCHGVAPGEVMVTSGATDAIWLIAQAFRHKGSYKVFHPTFCEYEDACQTFGYVPHPDASLCWLCNPNNPTGEAFSLPQLRELAHQHELLVIDQSYEDYTLSQRLSAEEAISWGNVLQIRSMTKSHAIPGLRLGYITAPSEMICYLRSQYRPWAVNALALEAGKWLLCHDVKAIPDLTAYLLEAQRLRTMLEGVEGIGVMDTQTNFMLCHMGKGTAAELKSYLVNEHGMLIRDASNFKGLDARHFRVAAQSPDENDALVAAVTSFMKTKRYD